MCFFAAEKKCFDILEWAMYKYPLLLDKGLKISIKCEYLNTLKWFLIEKKCCWDPKL
jgi:hypothetical protein